ncbi:MAG: hypothetical protein H3C56_10910, partial [Chitinophagaceae bacterium]|nr:hypothetical protein [Chitinophagaceae bacterium]
MAKYNTKRTPVSKQVITNHQGGTGFKLNNKLELVSILMTGLGDKYYEKEDERTRRLEVLIDEIAPKDPEFIAKALV